MVKLGSRVKDRITGFTGIASGRAEYQFGCAQVLITPEGLKDGQPLNAHWFDEQRVEVVEETAPVVSPASSAKSGGPQHAPSRAFAPVR